MDGDTTEEDIDIPAHNTHSLARKMDSSRGDDVLAVPGQDEKSVHLHMTDESGSEIRF